MVKAKSQGKKKLPAAPLGAAGGKSKQKTVKHPLIEKTPRSYRVGGDIQPQRDLARFVRWPKYIQLQRQKRILLQRLKVPPSIAQFANTIDKNQASQLLRLLKKYVPETKDQKKNRLLEMAQSKKDGKESGAKKPVNLKFGLNHVAKLVEEKVAKLVVIAHDVDPIELVVWLPALCRKKDVPYCIIKGKSRLGQLCHKKTASCLAITGVRKEDSGDLEKLANNFKGLYNENTEVRRKWGGGIMGVKSQHITARREKALAIEQAKKAGLLG